MCDRFEAQESGNVLALLLSMWSLVLLLINYTAARYSIDEGPAIDVDLFWHWHMLQTEQYHRDCNTLFNIALVHQPKSDGHMFVDGEEHALVVR